MRKFAAYPIVINYNLHMQRRTDAKGAAMHRAGQYQQERQLYMQTSVTSDSSIESNLWKLEVEKYEKAVEASLRKIESNPVGRMVLGLIDPKTTVWIVPKASEYRETGKCNCAQTNPLNYEIQPGGSVARGVGFGDTVIQITAEFEDDILFHELVHAYRYSRKKFNAMMLNVYTDSLRETQSSEEFFAHLMQNMYLAQGHRPVTMDYSWGWPEEKSEIYEFLADNSDLLQALKYFLRHEYLAMLAAHSFSTDYNPFRDYKSLEAKWLEGSSLTELPEMGTQISH